jgi:hypothetical protein
MSTRVLCLVVLLLGAPLAGKQAVGGAPVSSTVEGQVVKAATGELLPEAQVRLRRVDSQAQPLTAVTDVSGRFAFTEVKPGEYRLLVQVQGYVSQQYGQRGPNHRGSTLSLAPGQRVRDIVFRLVPNAVIAGRVYTEDGEPVAGVSIQVLRYLYVGDERQLIPAGQGETNDLGEYRIEGLAPGQYYASATVEARPQDGEEGFAPTFYPGTTNPSHATPIRVLAGDELSHIDLTLLPVSTVRVRGQVINSVGHQPGSNTQVFLFPQALFEIRGAAPGSYNLVAVHVDEEGQYLTRMPIDVWHTDVEDIALVIRPGVDLAGRVYVEGNASGDQPGKTAAGGDFRDQLKMTELAVYLRPLENAPRIGKPEAAKVKAGGSFELENVAHDKYRVNVLGLPEDYYLKAARVGGRNVLDVGLDLSGGRPWGKLELVVSSAGARLDGVVMTEELQVFGGASVLLIAEERSRRDPRLAKTTTTDQYGRFSLRGIAPGEYTLLACAELEPGVHRDPEFLRRNEDRGDSVRVQEGDRRSIQLEVLK